MADKTTSPAPTSPQASGSPTPIEEPDAATDTVESAVDSGYEADASGILATCSDHSASPSHDSASSPGVAIIDLPTANEGCTEVHSAVGKPTAVAEMDDCAVGDVESIGGAPTVDDTTTVGNAATVDDATTVSDTAIFAGGTIKSPPSKIIEEVCFHVDADLLIKVIRKGCDIVYFRVSSGNFACASAVWRLDLYGSSNLRSSQDDPLPVDIGDSQPSALAVLMNIVHYRFGEVPTDNIELSELYHITQLTEKFMCTHLIRPWATSWIKNKEMRDLLASNGTGDGRLSKMGIKIAWELGASSLLKTMAEVIIMNVIVDGDGELVHGCGEKLKNLRLPQGMFETISKIRFDIVSKLLAAIQQPYDRLIHKDRFCSLNEHEECDATMLGSLTMQLATHGLFPVPTVGNYKGTLSKLKSVIDSIKLKRWEGKDIAPHLSHVGCTLGIADIAKAGMEGMRFSLAAPDTEHLEQQRRLSGIPADE